MAGKGIYGGDTNLEGRVDSLESGDAWDGAATGRVLTSGTPPTWEESSGGGVDLSAVDEDIVVVNDHVLRLTGDVEDAAAGTTVGWDTDGKYALRYRGAATNSETSVFYQAPDADSYLQALATESSVGIAFHVDGVGGAGNLDYDATNGLYFSDDVRFLGGAPVLAAPDNSLHRLLVANDGTLSTEPVV